MQNFKVGDKVRLIIRSYLGYVYPYGAAGKIIAIYKDECIRLDIVGPMGPIGVSPDDWQNWIERVDSQQLEFAFMKLPEVKK